MTDREKIEATTRKLTEGLLEQGAVTEGGFAAYCFIRINKGELEPLDLNSPPSPKLVELRDAFFAGALHVFSTIMNVMDEGEEPTEEDLKKMDTIAEELEKFSVRYYGVSMKGE